MRHRVSSGHWAAGGRRAPSVRLVADGRRCVSCGRRVGDGRRCVSSGRQPNAGHAALRAADGRQACAHRVGLRAADGRQACGHRVTLRAADGRQASLRMLHVTTVMTMMAISLHSRSCLHSLENRLFEFHWPSTCF